MDIQEPTERHTGDTHGSSWKIIKSIPSLIQLLLRRISEKQLDDKARLIKILMSAFSTLAYKFVILMNAINKFIDNLFGRLSEGLLNFLNGLFSVWSAFLVVLSLWGYYVGGGFAILAWFVAVFID